ncbi:hypothetical protein GH714_041175 [Hevea brasiliensis]|uniref:SWIM-type domain-containing protein n=1 Tax=Hevea brasiliensis TaxID=3981 RepID=A0A6A6MUZ9_HEVBR|nr:hypothetical protein GH714_041175 [Hevea brasiliensis]
MCRIEWNGEFSFEVTHGEYWHTVDLSKEKYTCRSCEIKGIPCPHAICCLFHQKLKPEDYISKYYTKKYYLKSYGYSIQPIKGMRLWVDNENLEIDPLEIIKKPSRPKKARRKDKDEVRKKTRKLLRKGLQMICGICKSKDHNRGVCPLKAPQTKVPQVRTSHLESQGSNVQSTVNQPSVAKQVNAGLGRGTSSIPAREKAKFIRFGYHVNQDKWFTLKDPGHATSKFIPHHRPEPLVKNVVKVTRDLGFKAKSLRWKGK